MAGGETYLISLIEHTPGITHSVVCQRGSGLADAVRSRGIEALEVDFSLSDRRRLIGRLADYCGERKTDLIHAHGFFPSWLALGAGRQSGLPVVVTAHNRIEDAVHQRRGLRAAFELWARRRLVQRLWFRAGAVMAVSHGVRDSICQAGIPADAITVVYNGVDIDQINQASVDQLPKSLSDIFKSPIIGTVARLEPFKGLENVLAVAVATRDSEPDLKFVVLGDGPEREGLMQSIKKQGLDDRVKLLGYIDQPAPVIRHFLAYFMSSPHEGINRAVLEAAVLGVPLILSPNRPEAFLDGVSAFIARADMPEQVASKIAMIRRSPELVVSVSQGGSAVVDKAFSAQAMATGVFSVYQRVLPSGV